MDIPPNKLDISALVTNPFPSRSKNLNDYSNLTLLNYYSLDTTAATNSLKYK
jgi:hypothetical protein